MKKYKIKSIIIVAAIAICHAIYAQNDSLNRYLEIAGQNNPAVKAAFHAYEASLQKIPQMGAWEDPRLDIGFFLTPMEIVGGRQIAQFQLMQMFPWFGVRKAARTEAQHMAKMAFETFRETRDNLYLEVYTQWYTLCNLLQKQRYNEENKKLLQQMETLALQRFSSGNGKRTAGSGLRKPQAENNPASTTAGSMSNMSMNMPTSSSPVSSSGDNMENMSGGGMSETSLGMSEVLRIQLEIAELDNNIESVRSEIVAGKALFNALLNRPVENEIVLPDKLSEIPFLFDIKSVMQMITEQNPMLGMIREETLAYNAKLEMEKKMAYPMFGVGLQYMLIGKTPETANPETNMENSGHTPAPAVGNDMKNMNGRDMLMPMLSITLPIYRNKYKAAQKESLFLRQASEEKYSDAFNRLQAELYQFKHQLDDAARKIALFRKQTTLARTTYDLALQEFSTGKSDLSAIIQIQRQLLDYQLKESEAIANYNTMTANIQKIISK